MLVLTYKNGDLSSNFVEFNEKTITDISVKEILIGNHITHANKGEVAGKLQLE